MAKKKYHIPRGATPLLTAEEQSWWLLSNHPQVRTLLWRLASEREKVTKLRAKLEGRNGND